MLQRGQRKFGSEKAESGGICKSGLKIKENEEETRRQKVVKFMELNTNGVVMKLGEMLPPYNFPTCIKSVIDFLYKVLPKYWRILFFAMVHFF